MATAHSLVIDRKGLAKKLEKRPKAFILYELLQNAWDEDVTQVVVEAHMAPGRPVCQISVEDDSPEGFQDLTSVYTMFKDSKKAHDPTKRGRFEMGEKLVLALALRAEVSSTSGTIVFEGDARQHLKARRSKGTVFEGEFRMTREDFAELETSVNMLAVPGHIKTVFNGKVLEPRAVEHSFRTTLQTIKADEEGVLSPTQRVTEVRVYRVREGEVGHIFEMGIPVVETNDPWKGAMWEHHENPTEGWRFMRIGNECYWPVWPAPRKSLIEVLDYITDLSKPWLAWKAKHPELFGTV